MEPKSQALKVKLNEFNGAPVTIAVTITPLAQREGQRQGAEAKARGWPVVDTVDHKLAYICWSMKRQFTNTR